tara:strand:- start:3563 stop:4474 length:912 start_codon:yes stop_codon:yes gene_type:complete
MKKEYIIILLVVGVGVYFFMKKTPQKKQLSNNEDEQDVIEVGDCPEGIVDECGICNGQGEVYECGCTDVIDGNCDCDGNVLDECGECGGGVTNPLLCSGVITDGEGVLNWGNRDYTTQTVQYANGTKLEWMTENAKYVDQMTYVAETGDGTTGRWSIYGFPLDMVQAITEADGNWEKYGGLYNYNMANTIKPSGWRLPTAEEFQGLLNIQDVWENDYSVSDFCSVEDWGSGLQGSNDSLLNFKGGGKIFNDSVELGENAYYIVNSGNPRQRAKFNPNSNVFEIVNIYSLSSLRFVREVVDVVA